MSTKSWNHVSASQIKKFLRCPRRWAWKYLFGQEDTPGEPLFFGIAHHFMCEAYQKGDLPKSTLQAVRDRETMIDIEDQHDEADPCASRQSDCARLVLAGIDAGYLVTNEAFEGRQGVEWSTHGDMDKLFPGGKLLVGYCDLFRISEDGRRLWVWDHKTTSSFRYSKSARQLRRNPQLILYTSAILNNFWREGDGPDEIEIGQYQYHKKNYGVRAVSTKISYIDVLSRYHELEDVVEDMKDVAEDPAMRNIEPNTAACSDYGGCFALDLCSPEDYGQGESAEDAGMFAGISSANSTKRGNDMDALDALMAEKKAEKKQKDAQTAQEAPQTAPEPEAGPTTIAGHEVDLSRYEDPEQAEERLRTVAQEADRLGLDFDPNELSPMTVAKYLPSGLIEQIKKGQEVQDEVAIEPPEAPEDTPPKGPDEVTLGDFDVTKADNIGKKGAQTILNHLADEFGVEEGRDVPVKRLEDYELTDLPGVGTKTAKSLREELEKHFEFFERLPDRANVADSESVDEEGTDEVFSDRVCNLKDGPNPLVKAKVAIVEAYLSGDDGEFEARKRKAQQVRDWKQVDNPFVDDLEAGYEEYLDRWVEQYKADNDNDDDDGPGDLEAAKKAKEELDETHPKPEPKEPASGGVSILLIDCLPERVPGQTAMLSELLEPLKAAVADNLGVDHYSLADYREGEKKLAGLVAANIEVFKGQTIVARSNSDHSKSVLEVLRPQMDMVISG